MSDETAGASVSRSTPLSIIAMSGLKPIILVSTGMAMAYTVITIAVSRDPFKVLALVGAGLFAWTFLEYVLHRWVLHWEPRDARLRVVRKCFPSHRPHHDAPAKERINVALQLKMTAYLSLAFTVVVWILVLPLSWSLALNAGILLGYQAYEYVHVACHHLPMRNAWARTLKRHHAIHHHRDETVNFGVTTTIWDSVFRTTFTPSARERASTQTR